MSQSALLNKFQALFPGESEDVACSCLEEVINIVVPASAAASTTLATQIPVPVPNDGTVIGARYCQTGSGASNVSNYATIRLNRRYAGGTLSSVVAAVATSTSACSISALVALPLTVATSLAEVSAGNTLDVTIEKAGDGLSTGAGILQVRLRRR